MERLWNGDENRYPLVNIQKAIEAMAIVVDIPNKFGDFP